MGVATLAPAPAKPAPAKAPTAARPPAHVIPPKRTLSPPTCECGASAGFSGRCESCDRVSLRPRPAGVPEPLKKIEVASARPHPGPEKPKPDADALGLRSAVAAKPVAVREVSAVRVQTQMRVSSPSDPAEQEASAVGKTIMRMPNPDDARAPPPAVSHRDTGVAQRDAAAGAGHRHADPQVMEKLHSSSSSGSPVAARHAHVHGAALQGRLQRRAHPHRRARSASGRPAGRAGLHGRAGHLLRQGRVQTRPARRLGAGRPRAHPHAPAGRRRARAGRAAESAYARQGRGAGRPARESPRESLDGSRRRTSGGIGPR